MINRIEKGLLFLAGAAVWGEVLMYVLIFFVGLFGTAGLVLLLGAAVSFAYWVSRDSRSEGRAAFGGLALCLLSAVFMSVVKTPDDIPVPMGLFLSGFLLFSFAVFSRLYGFGKPATAH